MRQTTLRELDTRVKKTSDIAVDELRLDRSGVQPVLEVNNRVIQGSPSDLAALIRGKWTGAWIAGYDTVEPGIYDLNRPFEAAIWVMDGFLQQDVAVVRGTAPQIMEVRRLLEKKK